MKVEKDFIYESKQEVTNGASWSLNRCWDCVINQYGLPFLHYCISVVYAIYTHATFVNAVLLFVKIVPTGVYVGNLVRNIYVTTQDRLRLNESELEDLRLQIQIINTKLRIRDAELLERREELRKGTEKFYKVRARVREVIAADEGLRHSLHESVPWEDAKTNLDSLPEEREFILQLLKDLKYDEEAASEVTEANELGCEMRAPSETASLQEESIYTSASEADAKQNCQVKIVQVTNVFKVAYLKHFLKQKKLRRATKHANLKKKVETVKQFLADWQKMLNMVINNKMSLLNMDPRYIEAASHEARGDYSKQDLRDFSETDSEICNFNEDHYEPILVQNSNRNFTSSFEDTQDTAVSRETNEPEYSMYQRDCSDQLGCKSHVPNNSLADIPEETVSHMAIEEIRSEGSDEYECRDVILI